MKRSVRLSEGFFAASAWGCALLTLALFVFMLALGAPLFSHGGFGALVFGGWNPAAGAYGIYPMLVGTAVISITALALSVVLCLGCALFITLYAPPPLARVLLGVVRLMSAVPTVVYAFISLFTLVPFMRTWITGGSGLSALTAALVLALLIAPTIIMFFVDALQSVPASYLSAIDILGGTSTDKLLLVMLPCAWPGMLNGILLGLGRAMGDTIISLMLAGNSVAVPHSVLAPARTLTAHIALVIASDITSLEFRSVFGCAAVLYLFTVVLVSTLRVVASRKGC